MTDAELEEAGENRLSAAPDAASPGVVPADAPPPAPAGQAMRPNIARRNFWFVQIDGVGVGIANAAAQYLAPFLTLLQATNTQVGMLNAMPGLTGLLLTIPVGNFLQSRRNVAPWYGLARLLYLSSYTLTGILPFFFPREWVVEAILACWALATIPQILLNVCFNVVMNAVAGPHGRMRLMSWRWSILGLVTGIGAFIAGQLLDRMSFPLNYQIMFIVLSAGGLVSYYFSTQLVIPDNPPRSQTAAQFNLGTLARTARENIALVSQHPAFVAFSIKRVIFLFGMWVGLPLFPLYYVRELGASNAWLGSIVTAQTVVLMVGYFVWTRMAHRRGSRLVLLLSTLGAAVFPALIASTQRLESIVFFAGLASIMQAGIDLTFFDELLKTVPVEHTAIFIAIAQTMSHVVNLAAPLLGAFAADHIGIANALFLAAGLRFFGFLLFLLRK